MTSHGPYLAVALALAACTHNDDSSGPLGGSRTVTGSVIDFETKAEVSGTASVSTTALDPAPKITVEGSRFTLDGVPENSAFQILATVAPTHRGTYSPVIEVGVADVDNAKAFAVSEQFLTGLASGFSVTPTAAKGVLLLHLVDATGAPKAGVAASNLVLANAPGASAPKFLDAMLHAAPSATTSSTSGWVAFF